MIGRLRSDGITDEACEIWEIKAGDVFCVIDEAGKSPWLKARKDACQIPHPGGKDKMVWHVNAGFINEHHQQGEVA